MRLAFEWFREQKPSVIYIPNPTWGNHKQMVDEAHLKYKEYPYWNAQKKSLDIDGFLKSLNTAPTGSVFLLHSCAHNPTGCDPTKEQWRQIADAVIKNGHFVLFDSAYQGFASGDFQEDAYSIRLFMELDIKFLLCQSFAKNFGLYGERVGALHAFTDSKDQADRFISNISVIIRTIYSNPPKHGAYIVDTIYRNPELFKSFLVGCNWLVLTSRLSSRRFLEESSR